MPGEQIFIRKRYQGHQLVGIMTWYHHQQVLRRIQDKDLNAEVKVDPPLLSWNPTQARWNGLHDKRPYHFLCFADNEGISRDIWGFE